MSSSTTMIALKDSREEFAVLMYPRSGHTAVSKNFDKKRTYTPEQRWRVETASAEEIGREIFKGETAYISLEKEALFEEALTEISKLASLEEDWNDEGAMSIDRTSILRAIKFIRWLSCIAIGLGLSGNLDPAVFPAINGGIRLYWKTANRQLSLTFNPGLTPIFVTEKVVGKNATNQETSENEAGNLAIEVMRENA